MESEQVGEGAPFAVLPGPVANLEARVPPEWWRQIFNELYLKTDGDVVENQENTVRDVDLVLRALRLQPDDRILDLCCGQGRHSIELARRGWRTVSGIDQASILISLARLRARQLEAPVSFEEGDARHLPCADGSFGAVILMGNSFGYFHDADDDIKVLREIRRVLRPGGAFAIDLSDGSWMRRNFEPRSWEWIDDRSFVCRERSLSTDRTRLVCRELVMDVRKGVVADQFYAMRLYTRRRIVRILKQMRFEEIVDHGLVPTESDRNQDLGLMSHRMFVTGIRPA
jgi:D-alanine-D-alanine ligase